MLNCVGMGFRGVLVASSFGLLFGFDSSEHQDEQILLFFILVLLSGHVLNWKCSVLRAIANL
jgi:hypothetical protein